MKSYIITGVVSLSLFAYCGGEIPSNSGDPAGMSKAQTFHREGVKAIEDGNCILAMPAFEKAHKLDPQNPEYANNLGWCLLQTKRSTQALEKFELAVRLKPAPLHFLNKGLAHLMLRQPQEAHESFSQAVKRNPEYYEAWRQLGLLEYGRAKLDAAEAAWRKAFAIKQAAEVQTNLGMLTMKKGDVTGAEAAFRAALQKNPDYAPAYYNLGVLLQQKGNLEGAEKAYFGAVKNNPKDYVAYFNLAIILEKMGKFGPARQSLTRFLNTVPPELKQQIVDAKKRLANLKRK